MATRNLLQANCERLLTQYHSNIQAVLALQTTLIRDILPSVTDELELSPEAMEWAKEWLEDTNTIFRICRRNNFTRSFAMESIRKNLIWRMNNLLPLGRSQPTSTLHCLPITARDPFDRPILIIRVPGIEATSDVAKPLILQTFERLRAQLQSLNETDSESPTLQYIVLLDLHEFSLKSFNKELITWTLREVIPRYPGMLAGVFMLNYSWVHSGMWNIIKHILPASALSRVFFPTEQELMTYFTPSSLPKDYGGSLPLLTHLDDPLRAFESTLPRIDALAGQSKASGIPSTSRVPTFTSLSPTSLLNPFFGYPATSSDGSLSLHHGRRRKRDLARTLAFLFWVRWRKPILVGLLLAVCTLAFKLGRRDPHFLRSFLAGKSLLSFKLGSK